MKTENKSESPAPIQRLVGQQFKDDVVNMCGSIRSSFTDAEWARMLEVSRKRKQMLTDHFREAAEMDELPNSELCRKPDEPLSGGLPSNTG